MSDAVAFFAIRNTRFEKKLIYRWNTNSWKGRKERTNKSNKKLKIRLRLTQLIVQHPCWLENGIVIPEYQKSESWQKKIQKSLGGTICVLVGQTWPLHLLLGTLPF